MVDYLAWASADPITVEQAAYLWAGVEPPLSGVEESLEERRAVAPRLQMLSSAVSTKELPVNPTPDEDFDPIFLGAYRVRRKDLISFAKRLKEQPAFLFDTMSAASPRTANTDLASQPKNKGGRPAEYDWDTFFLEIVRIADLDGLPPTRAELATIMRDWFIARIDDHPADTTIEDRIRPIYQYLEKSRKPPNK
jgi:hypothetical protein